MSPRFIELLPFFPIHFHRAAFTTEIMCTTRCGVPQQRERELAGQSRSVVAKGITGAPGHQRSKPYVVHGDYSLRAKCFLKVHARENQHGLVGCNVGHGYGVRVSTQHREYAGSHSITNKDAVQMDMQDMHWRRRAASSRSD